MTRSRLLTSAAVAVLCASALVILVLPRSGTLDPLAVVSFLLGLGVLTFADAWLPGGDTVSVSSALVIGALVLMNAHIVLGLLLLAEMASRAARGRPGWLSRGVQEAAVKGLAMAVAATLLYVLRLHLVLTSPATMSALTYAYYLSIGLLFAGLEFTLTQTLAAVRTSQPVRAWVLGGLELGGWLVAAEASLGVLSALMYQSMGLWGVIVAVVLVLVTRQSFALLLQIRQAYQSTVDVLIRTMDAQRPGVVESAESLADVCVCVGRVVGLHGADLEHLRYAALLYDLGLDEEAEATDLTGPGLRQRSSSRIIEGVAFLEEVVPILRLCEGEADAAFASANRASVLSAHILMAADSAVSGVSSERLAITEQYVSPRQAAQVHRAVARACASRSLSAG